MKKKFSNIDDLLDLLQKNAPQAFENDLLNLEKLEQFFNEESKAAKTDYQIQWNGKQQSYDNLRIQTRKELSLVPAKSLAWETGMHVLIEGDNIDALKILQPAYREKIKMIYIDPPYNTGSDEFIYEDDFSERNGMAGKKKSIIVKSSSAENIKAQQNNDSKLRHSNWLSMMLPRLLLSKNLMHADGFIFVSIGDNELANLRLLLDEVFGEENFRNVLLVRRYDKNVNMQFLASGLKTFNTGAEYVLIYSRNSGTRMNPVFRSASEERKTKGYWKGFWNDAERKTMQYTLLGVEISIGQWKWKTSVAKEAVQNYEVYLRDFSAQQSLEEYWKQTGRSKKFIKRNPAGKGKNKGVEHWIAPSDTILRNTLWQDVFASKVPAGISVPFNNPKNPELIKLLITIAFGEVQEGIVLDFFGGSGSTAHAVIDYNSNNKTDLHSITIQLPEKINPKTAAYKMGHRFISDITGQRIREVLDIQNAHINKEKQQTQGFRYFTLDENDQNNDSLAQSKLWSMILKAGFPLTAKVESIVAAKSHCYMVEQTHLFVLLGKSEAALYKILKDCTPSAVVFSADIFDKKPVEKDAITDLLKKTGIDLITI